MTEAKFLRHVAEACMALTDEEREVLAGEVTKQVAAHMRVRRLKAEAGTLPPPRDQEITLVEVKT